MNHYNDLSPLPALPLHLNPYRFSQPTIGRRFYFHNTPSPLRQSILPGEPCSYTQGNGVEDSDETVSRRSFDYHNLRTPSRSVSASALGARSSAPRDTYALGPPPGLESVVARNRFPEVVQQAIDHCCTNTRTMFDFASKGRLTRVMKELALEHSKLSLDTVKLYAERVKSHILQTHSDEAISQLKALEVELRAMKELRRVIKELPVP